MEIFANTDLYIQILLFVHKFIHRKNCLPNVFADYFVLITI